MLLLYAAAPRPTRGPGLRAMPDERLRRAADGRGRHAAIRQYDAAVAAALPPGSGAGAGAFGTAVTDWNVHAVCQMDRLVMRTAKERHDRGAPLPFAALPCDIVHNGTGAPPPPCPYAPPAATDDASDVVVVES